jgi:AcrR family transcriptional regulator
MTETVPTPAAARVPLSGRRAQAARNDDLILESAKAVFLADPGAPITAVARHAGVGISALYTRYGSKEELLRKLCADGLARFITETQAALAALAEGRDSWSVFARFMRRLVKADTSSMTLALAGKFAPTPEMFAQAEQANQLLQRLFEQVRPALRPDADVHDLSVIFEQVAAIKLADHARTAQLRQRYLELILAGIRGPAGRPPPGPPLPGPPPTWQELGERWVTSAG